MNSAQCIDFWCQHPEGGQQDISLSNPKLWKRIHKQKVICQNDIREGDFALWDLNYNSTTKNWPCADLEGIIKPNGSYLQPPLPCIVRIFELKDSDYYWAYIFTDITDSTIIGISERSD